MRSIFTAHKKVQMTNKDTFTSMLAPRFINLSNHHHRHHHHHQWSLIDEEKGKNINLGENVVIWLNGHQFSFAIASDNCHIKYVFHSLARFLIHRKLKSVRQLKGANSQ
jgi:hypothetical protein